MSCPFAHDDAAYVLAALPPADRLAFERHLAGCSDCARSVREIAGLPGLLSRVDVVALEEGPGDDPVPDSVLPTLARGVRRARRRRVLAAAGLAAAMAAGLTTAVVWQLADGDSRGGSVAVVSPSPSTGPFQAMQPVGDVPVQASLALERVAWGTRLNLTCTYDPSTVEYELPPAVDYVLVVRTRGGRWERVGSWRSVGGRTMRLSAATAATRGNIASVQVRTLTGRVVLELTA